MKCIFFLRLPQTFSPRQWQTLSDKYKVANSFNFGFFFYVSFFFCYIADARCWELRLPKHHRRYHNIIHVFHSRLVLLRFPSFTCHDKLVIRRSVTIFDIIFYVYFHYSKKKPDHWFSDSFINLFWNVCFRFCIWDWKKILLFTIHMFQNANLSIMYLVNNLSILSYI